MLSNTNRRARREASEKIVKEGIYPPSELTFFHQNRWFGAKSSLDDMNELLRALAAFKKCENPESPQEPCHAYLSGDTISLGVARWPVFDFCITRGDSSTLAVPQLFFEDELEAFIKTACFPYALTCHGKTAELKETKETSVCYYDGTDRMLEMRGFEVEKISHSDMASLIAKSEFRTERMRIRKNDFGETQVLFPKDKYVGLHISHAVKLYVLLLEVVPGYVSNFSPYSIRVAYVRGKPMDKDLCLQSYRLHTDKTLLRRHMHLHAYMVQKPVLQQGAIYIMDWAKESKLFEHRILSEYIVSILWIYFLFRCKRELAYIPPSSIPEEPQEQDTKKLQGESRPLWESSEYLGERITDFFVFYAKTFDFSTTVVTLSEADGYPGTIQDWISCRKVYGESHVMCVEDPYKGENLTGTVDAEAFAELQKSMKWWLKEKQPSIRIE